MKIYNYGNDYAFQRKQKSKESVQVLKATEPGIVASEEVKDNAEDKIQTGGKGNMADAPQSDASKQVQKTNKQKKENDLNL